MRRMKINRAVRLRQNYQNAVMKNYILLYGRGAAEQKVRKVNKQKFFGISLTPAVLLLCMLAGNGFAFSLCAALLFAGSVYIVPDLLLRSRWETVRISFGMDMPNFLDVVCLLLEAGHPLWHAIEIGADINQSPLCLRIKAALHGSGSAESGQNPELLLEKMTAELQVPIVSSVMSAVIQNSRKGESELVSVLRMQSLFCRNERKLTAEKLGNRASTLLLIPSALVFIAILIMLITPAVMQLKV